jgi:hypothetical protein
MPALKLAKLPDRTPVKVTLTLHPELHKSLVEYSEVYRKTYGEENAEPISEIIPAILQSFVDGDRTFAKARKDAVRISTPRQTGAATPRARAGA